MSNAFLGQITMFAGAFAPKDTAFCNGQTLQISQNQALFSLLGTTYGGNGQTTFALPNLQSRLPVHQGTGPGLSPYFIGQASGAAAVTIDASTMPQHSHTFNTTTADATAAVIANTLLPATPTLSGGYAYATQAASPNPTLLLQTMPVGTLGNAGGSQAHANLMPSLCISFIIVLSGIFPSRN